MHFSIVAVSQYTECHGMYQSLLQIANVLLPSLNVSFCDDKMVCYGLLQQNQINSGPAVMFLPVKSPVGSLFSMLQLDLYCFVEVTGYSIELIIVV